MRTPTHTNEGTKQSFIEAGADFLHRLKHIERLSIATQNVPSGRTLQRCVSVKTVVKFSRKRMLESARQVHSAP